jgi:hypothetical protein
VIYSIHCKNFCKCHNVPPPSITIKTNKWIKKKWSINIFTEPEKFWWELIEIYLICTISP